MFTGSVNAFPSLARKVVLIHDTGNVCDPMENGAAENVKLLVT
jgi:hypothetical protein